MALRTLIPQASVTRYLASSTPLSRVLPGRGGSRLAADQGHPSSAIVPLFAGIYQERRRAGTDDHLALFFAPAGDVLALAYTGSILGAEFAFTRFVLCLLFGIGIGMLMAMLFWRGDASHDQPTRCLVSPLGRLSARPPSACCCR